MLWSSGGLSNAKLTWLLQPKVFEVMRIVICQCTWVQHIYVTNVKILLQILLTCNREKLMSNVACHRYQQHSNVHRQKLRFKNRKIRWEYPRNLTTKSTNFLKFCEFLSCQSVSVTRFGMSVFGMNVKSKYPFVCTGLHRLDLLLTPAACQVWGSGHGSVVADTTLAIVSNLTCSNCMCRHLLREALVQGL
jgi:hypothetical protein